MKKNGDSLKFNLVAVCCISLTPLKPSKNDSQSVHMGN